MGTQRQFQTLFHTPTLKNRTFIPFLLTTEEDRQGLGYLRRWKQHRDGWVHRQREREREREREIPNPTPRPLKKSIPMAATTTSLPTNTNKRLGVHKVVLGTQFFLNFKFFKKNYINLGEGSFCGKIILSVFFFLKK